MRRTRTTQTHAHQTFWKPFTLFLFAVVFAGALFTPSSIAAQSYPWCTGAANERCGASGDSGPVARASAYGPFMCDVCLECVEQGSCQLPDVMIVGGNIGNFLLSIVGTIALVVFVIGGVLWITAGGNPDRVKKAQRWFWAAIVGIIISFSGALLLRIATNVIRSGAVGAIPDTSAIECQDVPDDTVCGNGEGVCRGGVCINLFE